MSTPAPGWNEAQIRTSRTEVEGAATLPAKPMWRADPLNVFLVVEGGDHHVSVVDGDRFEVIHRFASRFALHGGPKFSPDGRFVYFEDRSGLPGTTIELSEVAGPKGTMFRLIREAAEGWDGSDPVRPFPDLSKL